MSMADAMVERTAARSGADLIGMKTVENVVMPTVFLKLC